MSPHSRLPLATILYLSVHAAPAPGQSEGGEPASSGEDIVQLTRRLDLRFEVSGTGKAREQTFTVRYDRRSKIGNGWQLNLRADAPFKRVEEGGQRTDFGRGDFLIQAVVVKKLEDGEGFGFGTQLILPTGVKEEGTKAKWRLRPIAGYRWPLASIGPGSFFQLQVRYDGSFAGSEDRRETRELQVSPNLEMALPRRFYVSFFPSADFRYDFVHNELFVPVDVEVGKDWRRVVWSVEGAAGLIKGDHAPYDWKVETRVGFKF